MVLQELKYKRFEGQPTEWSLEGYSENLVQTSPVLFGNINLIVGRNASGKTKAIDVIRQLADLLTGNIKLSEIIYNTASYELVFIHKQKHKEQRYDYSLSFINGKVSEESLRIDSDEKLTRNSEGGKMYYEKQDASLEFLMEEDRLAVSRVDTIQQSFLKPLQEWGRSLSHYRFGDRLGKNTLLRNIDLIKDDSEIDFKDSNKVTGIFVLGFNEFGDEFTSQILSDMKTLDYELDEIAVDTIKFLPLDAYGIVVKEKDLDTTTDQKEMSQGMFRALSLLIQINYSLLSGKSKCILIDDIGEGLDYNRSTKLINLIIEKVQNRKSNIQLIMTTNDRFVMNNIPLKYWSVIQRMPRKSVFYNYINSKEVFDDFEYTGLSNFDFLATDFFQEGFEK